MRWHHTPCRHGRYLKLNFFPNCFDICFLRRHLFSSTNWCVFAVTVLLRLAPALPREHILEPPHDPLPLPLLRSSWLLSLSIGCLHFHSSLGLQSGLNLRLFLSLSPSLHLNAFIDPEEPLVEGDLLSLDLFQHLFLVDLDAKVGVALTVQDLDGQNQETEKFFLRVVFLLLRFFLMLISGNQCGCCGSVILRGDYILNLIDSCTVIWDFSWEPTGVVAMSFEKTCTSVFTLKHVAIILTWVLLIVFFDI